MMPFFAKYGHKKSINRENTILAQMGTLNLDKGSRQTNHFCIFVANKSDN
jgi:hypothetical protein